MKNKKDKYLIKTLFIVFVFLLILSFCFSCISMDESNTDFSKYPKGIITEIRKGNYDCDCKVKFLQINNKPLDRSLFFNFNCDSIKVGDTVDLNIRRK